MKDIKKVVQRQIYKTRELLSERYGMKRNAPTLTYKIPQSDENCQRAFELGINIGWVEGLEFVENWIADKENSYAS